MNENPDRENIMKVWKNYNIKDTIIIIEKAMKAIRPKTMHSCWKKLSPDVVRGCRNFDRPNQQNHKRD